MTTSQFSLDTFESIYGRMIAGRVPHHGDSLLDSVALIAADLLDSHPAAILVSAQEHQVDYLAVPAVTLASTPGFMTPLAAALVSHPDHQGPGIYFLTEGALTVAIQHSESGLRCLFNSTDVLTTWMADSGLPAFDCANAAPWPLQTRSQRYRQVSDQLLRRTMRFAGVTIIAALALYLAAQMFMGFAQKRSDDAHHQVTTSLRQAMAEVQPVSPLSTQMGKYNQVSWLTVRAGGWINFYELKGDAERFELTWPAWVSKDYTDVLGPQVITDLAPAPANQIIVRKGVKPQ